LLVIVGTGPEAPRLIARGQRSDLRGGVVFAGQVPHARVPSLLRSFDVAIAPYRPIEGFYFHPLKVVEYLASGTPVIYSAQGDLPALVGPGGLGYAAGSIQQLADRLRQVLGDAERRSELAAAAAERGAAHDWSVIADRVVRFAAGSADVGLAGTASTATATARAARPTEAQSAVAG
jgi:glycosyltransferase involved in cell wall biosynthesis